MHSLENLSCPCNHELKFSQNTQDLMKWFENLNYPIITSWNFRKNRSFLLNWIEELPLLLRAEIFAQKTVLMMSVELLNWPYYQELKFCENRQFWWCHSIVWPAPVITSWNVSQHKAVLMILLESLNWPYYHEVTFSQK